MRAVAAACVAAALLAPSVAAAPATGPELVAVSVGAADTATGFAVGPGRVLTVAHVLDRRGDVMVDGRRATVLRRDDRLDLAVLAVPGVDGEPPRVATHATRALLGARPARVVRRMHARVDGGPARPALEVRVDVAAGDSGAPLVTASGRLAGIIFARSRNRPSTAYAVDAAALGALLER